jgi:hypothetical protein
MKRTAAVTLVCMGAGAAALGAALEKPCAPSGQASSPSAMNYSISTDVQPTCRYSGGAHGHGGGSFFGTIRGGFGAAGRGAGS